MYPGVPALPSAAPGLVALDLVVLPGEAEPIDLSISLSLYIYIYTYIYIYIYICIDLVVLPGEAEPLFVLSAVFFLIPSPLPFLSLLFFLGFLFLCAAGEGAGTG